jgi:hypothetical protein
MRTFLAGFALGVAGLVILVEWLESRERIKW